LTGFRDNVKLKKLGEKKEETLWKKQRIRVILIDTSRANKKSAINGLRNLWLTSLRALRITKKNFKTLKKKVSNFCYGRSQEE